MAVIVDGAEARVRVFASFRFRYRAKAVRMRVRRPRFKSDLNLDLLRSMHYLGSLCIVRRQAFMQAGRLGDCKGAEGYDIALRVLDNFGVSTIGPGRLRSASAVRLSERAMPSTPRRRARGCSQRLCRH